MRRKMISLLLAGCLILGLAACGNSGSGSSSAPKAGETQAGSEAATKTAAEDRETTADDGGSTAADGDVWECVIPWPSIGDAPAGLADIEAAVNEITIPSIGVKVVINPIYCFDLNSQQTLMISSGDKLDLCLIMMEPNTSYVNNGSIIALNDLYATYGANINSSMGDAVEACSVNGNLYSIPVASAMGNSYGYLMRSDLLEKYGFDSTDRKITLDEFEKILAAIKEGEGNAFYPIANLNTYDAFFRYDELGSSVGCGVLMLDKDTENIVNLFESEEYAAYAQKTYEWAQKGYISPDATSTDGAAELIKAGGYGGQGSSVNPGQSQWSTNASGYDMTSLEVIAPYSKTTNLSSISWGITANCDNPEKAMQLIDLMFGDNNFGTIMGSGLEGASYEIVESNEDGDMIISYPEGLDSTTVPYYNMFGVWPNNRAQFAPLSLDHFKQLDEFNANMEYSPAFGYTFDATEQSTKVAAIESIIAQYKDAINGGKVDPATQLPAFIAALKDAGIDEVIQANQAQYDAWKSAK